MRSESRSDSAPEAEGRRDLGPLERALGYCFRDRELLETAVTHSSHAHENSARAEPYGPDGAIQAARERDNERLEFLGDAVLGLVASEELVGRFPGSQEGQLSKLRAHLVSQHHLITVAGQLQLGRYLRLGRGEEKSGGRHKAALLVDALEAVIGAMYLDGGLETVRPFVRDVILSPELAARAQDVQGLPIGDYKSALQEVAHAMGRVQPSYVLVDEEGPPHRRVFTVEVRLHRNSKRGRAEYVASARGATKKMAEQSAAREALAYLRSARTARLQPGPASGSSRAGRRSDQPNGRNPRRFPVRHASTVEANE
ncbi:MAG: ribonuclease III [Acidobacteria bacterium]|nr:ribonuclease III [Acidobacteriota bacterium]